MRSRERAPPVHYLRTLADSRRIIKAAEAARRAVVFGSPKATGDLLSIIAGGLMTVTSITISLLLLLALQQAAVSMPSEPPLCAQAGAPRTPTAACTLFD